MKRILLLGAFLLSAQASKALFIWGCYGGVSYAFGYNSAGACDYAAVGATPCSGTWWNYVNMLEVPQDPDGRPTDASAEAMLNAYLQPGKLADAYPADVERSADDAVSAGRANRIYVYSGNLRPDVAAWLRAH